MISVPLVDSVGIFLREFSERNQRYGLQLAPAVMRIRKQRKFLFCFTSVGVGSSLNLSFIPLLQLLPFLPLS